MTRSSVTGRRDFFTGSDSSECCRAPGGTASPGGSAARPPAGPGGSQEAEVSPASAHRGLRAVPPPGQATREGPR